MQSINSFEQKMPNFLKSPEKRFFILIGIGSILTLLAFFNMYFLTKPFPAGPECLADPEIESCFNVSGHPVFYMISEAFIAFTLFAISSIGSILYLIKKDLKYDVIVVSSAKIGILASLLTLLVGIFWSRVEWGHYWEWEARQTMTLIMFLFYVGMVLFRSSVDDIIDKAKLTAVFGLVAFPTVPMANFIVGGLHPQPQQSIVSGGNAFIGAIFMYLGMLFIYLSFLYLTIKLEQASNKVEEYKQIILATQE